MKNVKVIEWDKNCKPRPMIGEILNNVNGRFKVISREGYKITLKEVKE